MSRRDLQPHFSLAFGPVHCINCAPHSDNRMLASISRRSISVFFPAFNDEQTIGSLVIKALNVLEELADDYEVLVINDGSIDRTPQIIDKLSAAFPQVVAIHHEQNLGYGAALQSGFRHAKKELVFYTDGDGQYEVDELRRMLPLMTDDVDVVNGYKSGRADSRKRKVIGEVYNRAARKMFGLPIRDVDCDCRLIRRSMLPDISTLPNSGAVCVQLVRQLAANGATFSEIPVGHYPRLYGKSQFFTVSNITRTLIDFGTFAAQACIAPIFFWHD